MESFENISIILFLCHCVLIRLLFNNNENKRNGGNEDPGQSAQSYSLIRAFEPMPTSKRKKPLSELQGITKTCLFKYTEHFNHQKNEKQSDKNSDISHTSGLDIDCGYSLEPPRRGGSNEYPQSMFLSRNKKNNVYPVNPSFTI